ncbi:MAG TPA: hypothetical protein VED17_03925 [Nitrososphaerales archaeon]|nr:hypothetical protein [Nitrososphaerales archaeon]
MAINPANLVVPAIDLGALVVTGLSGYYVSRQSTTLYKEVKTLLLYVHIFFIGVLVLEFIRNFVPVSTTNPGSVLFISIYTILGTSFILWDVLLLMTVGAAVYLKPEGQGLRELLVSIIRQKTAGIMYILVFAIVIGSDLYLVFVQPFIALPVVNIAGITVLSTKFDTSYVYLVLLVLLLFLTYPTSLFLLARNKTKDKAVRRALLLLPIVWGGIGVDLAVFNGIFLSAGEDYVAVGYFLAAVAFAITATIFRRASLLSGFFGPMPSLQAKTSAPTFPFSNSLKIDPQTLIGRTFLFLTDPSTPYEKVVDDLAVELLSNKEYAFVFTSKRSPIQASLSKVKGVRYYILTSSVSYPRGTDVPDEILVPQNDQAILLDIIQKTILSDPEAKLGIIYDNISDMILSSSVESSYKFLKQANEIIDPKRVMAMFLFTPGAHDDRTVNLVKALFANHIVMVKDSPQLAR